MVGLIFAAIPTSVMGAVLDKVVGPDMIARVWGAYGGPSAPLGIARSARPPLGEDENVR
jgi:hypothetical protein